MPPAPPILCTRAYSSSSAAKTFVRLLCASSTSPVGSSSSNSSSILDVLLPPPARTFHVAAAAPRALRGPAPLRARSRNSQPQRTSSIASANAASRRPFSATASWRQTQVVYNPQKDEDGNDMILEITPRAANRLTQIMAKDKNPHLALRISVESGGCHGFQYLMSLTSLPPSLPSAPASTESRPPETSSSSPPIPANPAAASTAAQVAPSTTTSAAPAAPRIGEDDTVFAFVDASSSSSSQPSAAAPAKDAVTYDSLPKIVLDGPSLELLKGSKVDFTMELIGSQFKIVDNPLATSSCGCGTSFDIKI